MPALTVSLHQIPPPFSPRPAGEIAQTYRLFVGDDKVVEEGNVEELAELDQPLRDGPVLLGGRLPSAGMVVRKDEGCGIMP